MTCLVKLGLILAGAVAIVAVPSFLYGMVGGGTIPDWWGMMLLIVLIVYVFGSAVYLAVDLALRHNRRVR